MLQSQGHYVRVITYIHMLQSNSSQMAILMPENQTVKDFVITHRQDFQALSIELAQEADKPAFVTDFLEKLLQSSGFQAVSVSQAMQRYLQQGGSQQKLFADQQQIMAFFQFMEKHQYLKFKANDQQLDVQPASPNRQDLQNSPKQPGEAQEQAPDNTTHPEQQKKEDSFQQKLHQTIQRYETALITAQEKDRPYIIRTIESLKKQLAHLKQEDSRAGQSVKSAQVEKVKRKRQDTLRQLFLYYCKVSHVHGTKGTFDRIQHETTFLNWQKLIAMLKDLQVYKDQISKADTETAFKKATHYSKQLSFEQFQEFIKAVAKNIFSDKEDSEIIFIDQFVDKYFSHKLHFTSKFRKLPFSIKEGFRSEKVDYHFAMVPHSGKIEIDLKTELLKRKQQHEKDKQEVLTRRQKVKERYLQKLKPRKKESLDLKSSVFSMANISQVPSTSIDKLGLPIEQLDSEEQEIVSNQGSSKRAMARSRQLDQSRNVALSTRKRAESILKDETISQRRRISQVTKGSSSTARKKSITFVLPP